MEGLYVMLIFGYLAFAFRYRSYAVMILPLVLPLYLVRFSVFGVPFTLLEGFIYAIGVPVLIDFVKDIYKGHLEWSRRFFLMNVLFLACVIGVIVVPKQTLMIDGSTVFEGQRVALGVLKGFILAPMIYFVSFMRTVKTDQFKNLSVQSYIAGATILALWGMYQTFTGDFITPDFRASGPFESANYLALYLGPACVAAFIYFWYSLQKDEKIIRNFVIFAILFVGLFLTKSYGAVIGLFAGILFFVLYSLRLKWRLISIGVLAAIFVGVIGLNLGSDKFNKLFEFEERSSSAVRIEVWTVALDFIKESPIFGIGLGQFEPKYQLESAEILGHAPFEWVMLHPHNLYLMFWLSSGIIGLAAFVGLLISAFRSKEKKVIYVLGASMLVVILVHGLFDVPFWKNDLAIIFWLTLGVLL